MSDLTSIDRKIYRNIGITDLGHYRLPAAGVVSILHRISGAGMFLFLPFLLYLFKKSVTSEISFSVFRLFMSHWYIKLIMLGLIWAFLHHLIAGVRHLFMDAHHLLEKDSGRNSALAVLGSSILISAIAGLKLFGAF
jgi:succinate dehydrogenase / fumarate reductase, cytochrome b subunit